MEDIKASYRKLSLEFHPDTAKSGCAKSNALKFSEISQAYETLSNTKERRRYDLRQQEHTWYEPRGGGGGGGFGSYSAHAHPSHEGPKATGVYKVLETMFRPRNFLGGIVIGIGSFLAWQSYLNQHRSKQLLEYRQGAPMVEAWKNPTTGQWEQAAPWDPTYRRLQPTLQLVPRNQVQSRTR